MAKTEKEIEPLPADFYKSDAWLGNLVKFYSEQKKLLPQEALEGPLDTITTAIQNVIDVYGNFPDSVYKLFLQTTDPLYEPGEYEETVYDALMKASEDENNPDIGIMGDSLFFIRRCFDRDKDLFEGDFAEEIEKSGKKDYEENLTAFSNSIHTIAKVHTNQVARLIYEFMHGKAEKG